MRSSPLPRMSRRGRVTVGVLVGVFLLVHAARLGRRRLDRLAVVRRGRATPTSSPACSAPGCCSSSPSASAMAAVRRRQPLPRLPAAPAAAPALGRSSTRWSATGWCSRRASAPGSRSSPASIGLFAGLSAQGRWQQWMLFRNGAAVRRQRTRSSTSTSGFYVFDYPFWRYLLGVGFTAVVLSVIGALAVHYLFGGVRLQGVGDRMTTARPGPPDRAGRGLRAAQGRRVLPRPAGAAARATTPAPSLYGAGYTDINALLPAKEILAYISIVVAIAILVFSNAVMRNLVWPGVALALLGISAVAIGGIYPLGRAELQVKPSIARQGSAVHPAQHQRHPGRRSGSTRRQDRRRTPARTEPPPASLATDQTIVPNIRLLDPAVVTETFTQLQQVRGFYDFGREARRRPLHDRRQDRRTTWSACGRSTTPS